jgi:hypothetical protein
MRTTTIAEKINQETTSWLAAETKIRDRSVETENSSRRIRLGELICAEEKRRKRLMSKGKKETKHNTLGTGTQRNDFSISIKIITDPYNHEVYRPPSLI